VADLRCSRRHPENKTVLFHGFKNSLNLNENQSVAARALLGKSWIDRLSPEAITAGRFHEVAVPNSPDGCVIQSFLKKFAL
jgi:hypothetical protein